MGEGDKNQLNNKISARKCKIYSLKQVPEYCDAFCCGSIL